MAWKSFNIRNVLPLALNDLAGNGKEQFSRNLKQVIGHTAVLMLYVNNETSKKDEKNPFFKQGAEDIVTISHTGGDPGREVGTQIDQGVLASLNVKDVLMSHVKDGSLDSPSKIYWRMLNQEAPRVKRVQLCDAESVQRFKEVQNAIKCSKLQYYGLNTEAEYLKDSPITWTNLPLEEVTALLIGCILGTALRLQGKICLHSSMIAVNNRTIANISASCAGKSTTAATKRKTQLPNFS